MKRELSAIFMVDICIDRLDIDIDTYKIAQSIQNGFNSYSDGSGPLCMEAFDAIAKGSIEWWIENAVKDYFFIQHGNSRSETDPSTTITNEKSKAALADSYVHIRGIRPLATFEDS